MQSYQESMDRILKGEVERGWVKGASALVLHKGKELYCGAFGMADAEAGIPMGRDTIIRLYSMTKPVTAVAAMILVQRGEMDLWDPVSKFLPCFAGQKVWSDGQGEIPADREPVIFDLLNMTSGIPYPDASTQPGRRMEQVVSELVARRERGERVDTQAYMKGIASVPLYYQPGGPWMYGFSADVLGGVIEAVSGKTLGRFLKEEIFEPLDMPDTGFFVPAAKLGRFARHYEPSWDGGLIPHVGSHLGEYYGEDVAFESGGAGLVSTLDDYGHFASMMINGGIYRGNRILGSRTVDFMTKNRLTDSQYQTFDWTRGYGYGCLMRVLMDQGAAATNGSLGEFGWDGWTGNYVTMAPGEELVILYFIQRCGAGFTSAARKIRMATYGALEDEIRTS